MTWALLFSNKQTKTIHKCKVSTLQVGRNADNTFFCKYCQVCVRCFSSVPYPFKHHWTSWAPAVRRCLRRGVALAFYVPFGKLQQFLWRTCPWFRGRVNKWTQWRRTAARRTLRTRTSRAKPDETKEEEEKSTREMSLWVCLVPISKMTWTDCFSSSSLEWLFF